jgi:hypothetical protein
MDEMKCVKKEANLLKRLEIVAFRTSFVVARNKKGENNVPE